MSQDFSNKLDDRTESEAASRKQVYGQRLSGGRSRASKRLKALESEALPDSFEVKTKLVSVDFLANIEEISGKDISDTKTGAEKRKLDREKKQREEKKIRNKVNEGNKSPKHATKDQASKVRFKLGCGIEALTPSTLISLVESTAPYLFPTGERLVIDEDDEDSDLYFPFTSQGQEDSSRGDKHRETQNKGTENAADTNIRLSQLSLGTDGWKKILTAPRSVLPPASDKPTPQQREDYFALCLAAHFATVATFVPTDVDSKIRGHCWSDPDVSVLRTQFSVLKSALKWDVDSVSKRTVRVPAEDGGFPISGIYSPSLPQQSISATIMYSTNAQFYPTIRMC